MKITRSPASLLGLAMLLWTASVAPAQWQPEVRRARPVDESPVPRALPAEDSIKRTLRSLEQESSEPPARETERSITRTRCSLASFTIWRSQNIKNISTIIRDVLAGRTLTSR